MGMDRPIDFGLKRRIGQMEAVRRRTNWSGKFAEALSIMSHGQGLVSSSFKFGRFSEV